MQASEVMTRDVLTVGPETAVATAADLMVRRRVSGLPVVDAGGRVVGMFTEGDLLRRAETGTSDVHRPGWLSFLLGGSRDAGDYVKTHSRRVGDLMRTDVASLPPSADLENVVDLMQRRKVRRIPIVIDGRLVGIVSRLDLVRAVANKLEAVVSDSDDFGVEERLRTELEKQPWINANSIGVSVRNGVVTLTGFIYDERCRKALIVAASNVAGGVKVEDQLIWADPTLGLVVTA